MTISMLSTGQRQPPKEVEPVLGQATQLPTSLTLVQQAQNLGAAAVPNPSRLLVIDNPGDLSKTEKERIFHLYHQTYSRFSDESLMLTRSDFISRIGGRYDRLFIEKNSDGDISNVMLCRDKGNSNGCKVCLIFGGGSADDKESRVSNLLSLLKDNSKQVYIEASGPIAASILKDKEVPVAISLEDVPESLHYSSKKTRYGKKVIFGNSNSFRTVSPGMREFYALLYDYNKLKLKLSNQETRPQEIASKLVSLFNTSVNSQIPSFHKAVLSNKISSRLSAIAGITDEQKASQRDIGEFARNLLVHWDKDFDEISENLTEGDKEILNVLLGGKKGKILGESDLQ